MRQCCQLMGSALLIPFRGKLCSGDSAGLKEGSRRCLSSGCSTVGCRSTCGRERVARCTTSTKVKEANRETHQSHSSSLWDSTQLWKQFKPKCQTRKCLPPWMTCTWRRGRSGLALGTRLWESSFSGMQGSTSMKAGPKFGTAATSVHKRVISSNGWPGRPMQEPLCGEGLRCHHTNNTSRC